MAVFPSKLRRLLEPPHPAIMEAGAGGERLFAYTRLIFWSFIGLAPLSAVLAGGPESPIEMWIALGAVIVAIVFSVAVILVLRRRKVIHSIGYITSAVDVTIVTLALVGVALAGRELLTINSQIAWTVYLLVILASSLRYDIWLCLFVGLLSVIEYSALVWWVTSSADIPIILYVEPGERNTSLVYQIVRVMLMLASTAIAIGIAYRSRELVHASGTDRLTGLGNRAYFEERFAAELARVSRTPAPLTMVLFDLDFFKQFNDQWGHDTGDVALRMVARVINEESRKEDIVARWGGEEIALVLSETDIESAVQNAERIRERLATEVLLVNGEKAQLTVSCGLAQFPTDGKNAKSLFAAADRRLLVAKRSGRNRVIVDDSEETRPLG